MPELRAPLTVEEYAELTKWKRKLDKSKRAIVREALHDFFTKQKNAERGLDQVYIRSKHHKQSKLDLD